MFDFVVERLADWQRGQRMGSFAEYAAMTAKIFCLETVFAFVLELLADWQHTCVIELVLLFPPLLVNMNLNKGERKGRGLAVTVAMLRCR